MALPEGTVRAIDALLLAAGKALVGAWILHLGFTHVSDDDYARTVIAERFAHAPTLDPSGTSWLPLPFWVEGAAMMVFGRSLGTARGVAVVLGALAVVPVYVALRSVRVPRAAAVGATALGMIAPWEAWLGVATVPEAMTAGLLAGAAISMGEARARPWGGLALLAASLSRYEAWPVCATFAVCSGLAAVRRRREAPRLLVPAALALAGPLLWMAWNAHAHDGPLHFLRRVSHFRETAMGGLALGEKLLEVPRALVSGTGELLVFAALGVLAGAGDRGYRRRWLTAALPMVVLVAFLVYGAVRDEAPTHHPERALLALGWVLAGVAIDGLRFLVGRVVRATSGARQMLVVGALSAFAALGVALLGRHWPAFPGQEPEERRVAQTSRGLAYRDLAAGTLEVRPCAYEHFALIAAFGAPERVQVVEPATRGPTNGDCPRVVVR